MRVKKPFDYYTVWSFVLFAVVLGAAYIRLAIRGAVKHCTHLAWPDRVADILPPSFLLVGAIVNSILVGVGGQLLVAFGPKHGFRGNRLLPARRCAMAAKSHTKLHVIPLWVSLVSLAFLPQLLGGAPFRATGAAAVVVALWGVWFITPSGDGAVLMDKVTSVYGSMPWPAVFAGIPVLMGIVVMACVWRSRSCSDSVRQFTPKY